MTNNKRIYLCLAHMSGQEQKYIQEAFDTNWVVPLGPNVDGFERELEEYLSPALPSGEGAEKLPSTGASYSETIDKPSETIDKTLPSTGASTKNIDKTNLKTPSPCGEGRGGVRVCALSSGTAAIHLGLKMCGVGKGDEVIVQSFTFAASCNPVVYLGATPVLVDSEPETWNMDPELLEVAIKDRIAKTGRRPKAIVPVHMYGMPAKMTEIMEVAARYDIPIVEDAAEAFGSRYKGRMCGTMGRYGCLSFNGNKMITTSGGGAIVCPTEEDKRRAMFFATQARDAAPYYQHTEIGYNYRMSNICAGIGRGQMTVADEHVRHHRHVQKLYEAPPSPPQVGGRGYIPSTMIEVHRQPETGEFDSNYWLCTILVKDFKDLKDLNDISPNEAVLSLMAFLNERGIESRPLWKPMHLQPVYKDAPAYVNGVSEGLFRTGLCLPSGPCVSDEDVRYIKESIWEWEAFRRLNG